MQPLYPVAAGLVFRLLGLKAVIGFNILLLALNFVLVYKLLRLAADTITSFLAVLLVSFSGNIVFTAIFPWTEQNPETA